MKALTSFKIPIEKADKLKMSMEASNLCHTQSGAKLGLLLWVHKSFFFINYCITSHTNNYKPTFAHPVCLPIFLHVFCTGSILEDNKMCITLPEWMSQLRIQQHYLQASAEPDCPIIPPRFQFEQQMEFGQYSWLQKGVGFLLLKEINMCHTFRV